MASTRAATVFLAILALAGSARSQFNSEAENIYSNLRPGLPNYGIAQGSIFIVNGAGVIFVTLTASQSVPLQTSLAGVMIDVTVGGVTTHAIPYGISLGGITAILPSKTPVGTGTLTVTSTTLSGTVQVPIKVVESAFGLATALPAGEGGIAVAVDDSEGGQLLSQANAANPGEYLSLWGTGLGPVSGDETQYQTQTNLANIPIEVDIGGVSATVTYHGRSTFPGLDQINVIVPAGVSGCNVSVMVVAGGVPSNTATIPVASSGRICSDPALIPVTPSEYQAMLTWGNVSVGTVSLTKLTTASPPTAAVTTSDSVSAQFELSTSQQFASTGFLQQVSIGSCLVTNGGGPPLTNVIVFMPLDAGRQIDVNGPDGSLALPTSPWPPGDGFYGEPNGTSPAIIPSTGGTFTFDNGSGGADVGGFTASLAESLTAPFVWTNSSSISGVNRANGQTIAWTGGIPGSYVDIFAYSYITVGAATANGQTPFYVYFTCSAPLSAGQFTVPAAVLESLPPTGTALGAGPPSGNGYLYVVDGIMQRFSAPRLDLGLLYFGIGSGISVPFN